MPDKPLPVSCHGKWHLTLCNKTDRCRKAVARRMRASIVGQVPQCDALRLCTSAWLKLASSPTQGAASRWDGTWLSQEMHAQVGMSPS